MLSGYVKSQTITTNTNNKQIERNNILCLR